MIKKLFLYLILGLIVINPVFSGFPGDSLLPGVGSFLRIPQKLIQSDSAKQIKLVPNTPLKVLQEDIDAILDNPDFSNANIGIEIRSCDNGEIIYRKNSNKNFIPASTLKLFTTAAALDFLGSDFSYTTNLYLDGAKNKKGVFQGNLIIRGSGDPTISTIYNKDPEKILDAWTDKLDSFGIKSIEGDIIGDDSYFDKMNFGQGWAIDDLQYPFSAPVNALSVYENKVDFIISPGEKTGDKANVTIVPDNDFVAFVNNIQTVNANYPSDIDATKDDKLNIITLTGKIPLDTNAKKQDYKLSVSINNPLKFFLNLLEEDIESFGIKFNGEIKDISEEEDEVSYNGLEPFCSIVSPPLSHIIRIINSRSHNLSAEMLLKTLGKEGYGAGTRENGIKKIKKFAAKVGIPPDNLSIYDGSGLSRLNLLQPKYIVDLLYYIYRSDKKEIFTASLAVPGKEGTLKRRMTQSKAEKNVVAKTGSMNNVSNIAGYVRTSDGEFFAFTIMMNNFTVPESLAQNLQDLICMRLASFNRKQE